MAQFETPVKVKRGDDVREAANDTQLNQLLWDGFLVQDGEKAEPARRSTARRSTKASEDTRTPQQKAADTRRAKKAAAEGETAAENSGDGVVAPAASGDTAGEQSTAGSNPS